MGIEADIQNVATAVSEMAAAQATKMTDLEAAKLAANAAAVDIRNPKRSRNLYIGTTGDDLGDGSLASPVKSPGRMMELWEAMGSANISLITDMIWDFANIPIDIPYDYINIYGKTAANAYTQRLLTFVDSVNDATRCGAFRFKGGTKIGTYKVDILLNTSKNNAAFEGAKQMEYDFSTGSVARDPGSAGTATLIGHTYRAKIIVGHANFIIDPTAAGYVFPGVAAGVDPNTKNLIDSTFTSA